MKMNNKKIVEDYIREKFLTDGYEIITMDTISSKLKFSKKTIYKYYNSKEDLFRNIIFSDIKNTYQKLVILLQANDSMFEKVNRLYEIIRNHIILFNDESLVKMKKEFPQLWKEILLFRKKKVLPLINVLLDHSKKHFIISNYPNELIIKLFSSALSLSTYKKVAIQKNGECHSASDMIFEILLNGILTKKGKKLLAINKRMGNENS